MSDFSRAEVAVRIQEKFEFYLVALAFTILGLSIQTAKFESNLFANISELVGWSLLFISGLFGLLRLESLPSIFNRFAESSSITQQIEELDVLERKRERAKLIPVFENERPELSDQDILIKKHELLQQSHQLLKISSRGYWKSNRKYLIHKFALLSGVFALILSRMAPHVMDIIADSGEAGPPFRADAGPGFRTCRAVCEAGVSLSLNG